MYILERSSLRGAIGDPAIHKIANGLPRRVKLLLAMTILILLSGCSSLPKDRLVKNIKTTAHKSYDISYGELLAKYNLIGFSGKNSCLFAKNYGDIVGNEPNNRAFISYMSKGLKNHPSMSHKVTNKINIIYDNLVAINTKYNVIGKSDLARLKTLYSHVQKISHSAFDIIGHPDTPSHHLASLAKADALIDDIPVFMPMTDSVLTSKFGRRKFGEKKAKMHCGIDLAASSKYANIYAAANGVVQEIAASPSYGNFILIEHKKNFKTRYAHLHKLFVSRGERVFQGQLIGKQGSTGRSTNDHLHFEILHENHPIDPMFFVSKEYSCRKLL